MPRYLIQKLLFSLVILISIVLSSLLFHHSIQLSPQTNLISQTTPQPTVISAKTPTALPTNSISTQTATVSRVIDGDTIQIDTGQKVRLIGINTPETVDPRRPVECFGKEASARTKSLLSGATVTLVKDTSDTDKYGRLLRYVYKGDMFINLELVQEGYAFATPYPPDVKYETLFRQAEVQARNGGKGLWNSCPVPTS